MKRTLWISIVLVVSLSLVLAGCGPQGAAETGQAADEGTAPAVPVEVTEVTAGNIAAMLSYTGDLNPVQELSLVSIVSGAVEEVFVEVGDQVRSGDPILRIVDTTYKAQLRQAESGLALAQLNKAKMEKGPRAEQIALAEAGLKVAQANMAKLEKGPRQEQVAIARAGLDAAQAQLNSILTVTEDERTLAAANLAQAEAALKLAQAEYDKIKWAGQVAQTPQALQLQQATIAYETALAGYNRQVNPDNSDLAGMRAGIRQAELGLALAANPFVEEDFILAQAGVDQAQAQLALAKDPFTAEDMATVEVGIQQAEAAVALAQYQFENTILRAPFDGVIAEVYATVGSVASPQVPAIKLISNELEVTVEVSEKQIGQLYLGQPAALQVVTYPNQDFPALLSTIAPAADTSSRTFPVTITPLDEENLLKAGMFAEIVVLLEEKTGVVLIPRTAVLTQGGEQIVYVVSEDGSTVDIRPVTTGLLDPQRVEITTGLSAGERIATGGLTQLRDGAPIEIVTLIQ